MFSWVAVIFLWLVLETLFNINLFNTLGNINVIQNIWIYSIFLWIWVIWLLYIILLKELKEYIDAIILVVVLFLIFWFKSLFWINLSDYPILSWLVWAVWIFIFFFLQIVLSGWRALWGWDLRIAIMVWLALWISYSFAWMMVTYMVWSIIWIWLIVASKMKNLKDKVNTQVPFWPFLAVWFFVTIFFQEHIDKLLNIYL